MLSHKLKRLLTQTIDAVLPVNCAGCDTPLRGDPIPIFLPSVLGGDLPIPRPAMSSMQYPISLITRLLHGPLHQCGGCRIRPPAFSQAWTLYPYQSPLKEATWNLPCQVWISRDPKEKILDILHP